MRWWVNEITNNGKQPLALCLVAFVLTFVITRVITRMIRSGKGPFRDNVRADGTHIHHSVPGLVLLLIGAVTALAADQLLSLSIAGLMVGAGASLVLDEFALILHLNDVYWTHEGRASVQAVALTTMCLGLVLLGFTPATVEQLTDQDAALRWAVIVSLTVTALCCVICAMKGKYRLVLVAVFIPLVAYVAAVRLARPGSPWFRRYKPGSRKQRRAIRRAQRFDRHIDARLTWLADLIAGAPNAEEEPMPRAAAK